MIMKPIEIDFWKPHPEKPGCVLYDKGRSVQEVFEELKSRLDSLGYLPDEYFLMDNEWDNGRLWPQGGDIFCTVDYGASEGVYLDVYLKFLDESQKMQTINFVTGKTLGDSGADLDRMYLIAGAITKAFHGYGEHRKPHGAVVHLNPDEKKMVADALMVYRRYQIAHSESSLNTEDLIRRITDGEIDLPISAMDYGESCLRAVRARNAEKAMEMASKAKDYGLGSEFFGKMLSTAIKYHEYSFADEFIDRLAPHRFAEMGCEPLKRALEQGHMQEWAELLAERLIEKGIDVQSESPFLHYLTAAVGYEDVFAALTEAGTDVNRDNCRALGVCVSLDDLDAAKFLIDHGADFEMYAEWLADRVGFPELSEKQTLFLSTLRSYWDEREEAAEYGEDEPDAGWEPGDDD